MYANVLALGDVAAKRAEFYRQDKSFFVKKNAAVTTKKQ
jgi:hypothetical protein